MNRLNDIQPKNRTRHPFSKIEDIHLLQLVRTYVDKYIWYLIAYHIKCRERHQLFLSQGIHKKMFIFNSMRMNLWH